MKDVGCGMQVRRREYGTNGNNGTNGKDLKQF
jgi:hypothetical protein